MRANACIPLHASIRFSCSWMVCAPFQVSLWQHRTTTALKHKDCWRRHFSRGRGGRWGNRRLVVVIVVVVILLLPRHGHRWSNKLHANSTNPGLCSLLSCQASAYGSVWMAPTISNQNKQLDRPKSTETKISASHEDWLRQQNVRPGSLSYIKGLKPWEGKCYGSLPNSKPFP